MAQDAVRLVVNGRCIDIKPNIKARGRKIHSMEDGEISGSPLCTIIIDEE